MDNNLMDYVQTVDDGTERDQAKEDCLRNPVIVRKILEHISSKGAFRYYVNKQRYEARSVVGQLGNLIANLRSNQCRWDRCEAVEAFVADLPKLGAPLFSGISFRNDFFDHHCSDPPMDVASIYDVHLLDQLSLKSLTVDMAGPWFEFTDCPALLLAYKVLQQFCEVLEELELNISEGHGDFMENIVQFCKFPRLKILVVTVWTSNLDTESYFKALLARAPNLEMLYTDLNINSALQLLEGTSVGLVYTPTVCAPFDEISENVISAIKLESLELKYSGPGFNLERFNRIAPVLLQASCTTTLRDIFVDAELAVSLMCYGVRLENVKYLRMLLNYRILEVIDPRILNIIKNFDFTRIFPNLNIIDINAATCAKFVNHNHIHGIREQANAALGEPMPDRANSVKALDLYQWSISSEAAQFFAERFPNIENPEITAAAAVGIEPTPFGSIWENWQDLKELQVTANMLPPAGNLDSVFCGIFPEVADLREMDEEYLKRVNIVPAMPALTCLKNLRTLTLNHHQRPPFGDCPTFVFSKVTALLAFARSPSLTFSLKVSSQTDDGVPPVMTHLEPYVSVIFDFPQEEWDD